MGTQPRPPRRRDPGAFPRGAPPSWGVPLRALGLWVLPKMGDEVPKLRAALLQKEEALATLTKERGLMLKDIERFKENMKRGDMELRKAVGALPLQPPAGQRLVACSLCPPTLPFPPLAHPPLAQA